MFAQLKRIGKGLGFIVGMSFKGLNAAVFGYFIPGVVRASAMPPVWMFKLFGSLAIAGGVLKTSLALTEKKNPKPKLQVAVEALPELAISTGVFFFEAQVGVIMAYTMLGGVGILMIGKCLDYKRAGNKFENKADFLITTLEQAALATTLWITGEPAGILEKVGKTALSNVEVVASSSVAIFSLLGIGPMIQQTFFSRQMEGVLDKDLADELERGLLDKSKGARSDQPHDPEDDLSPRRDNQRNKGDDLVDGDHSEAKEVELSISGVQSGAQDPNNAQQDATSSVKQNHAPTVNDGAPPVDPDSDDDDEVVAHTPQQAAPTPQSSPQPGKPRR